jgi:hypothetical protein
MRHKGDQERSKQASSSQVDIANLFGDSDEMGDDLMDGGADEWLAEAYRRKKLGTSATRLRFEGKIKK